MSRPAADGLFVDPLGKYFWLISVDDIDKFDGGAGYQTALINKYCPGSPNFSPCWYPFMSQTATRLKLWNFNTIGAGASPYAFPVGVNGSAHVNTPQMPFVWTIYPAQHGVTHGLGLKDIVFGTDHTEYAGFRATFADLYDPVFSNSISDELADVQAMITGGLAALDASPWFLVMYSDQLDAMFGWRNNTTHPHTGWITAITSPVQVYNSAGYGFDIKALYTDSEVHTKTAWQTAMTAKYGNIAALNTAWGSSYTAFGSSATAVTGESLGTGDDLTVTFPKTLAHTVVDPCSVGVYDNGTLVAGDNCSGTVGAPSGVTSGSITYTTGVFTVTFSSPPISGHALTLDYRYGGWPKHIAGGTGLMDEDGSSSWMGTNPYSLAGANANTVIDLNNFLTAQATHYFSTVAPAVRAVLPHHLFGGPIGFTPTARSQILAAAGNYCDFLSISVDKVDQYGGSVEASLQLAYSSFGKPIIAPTLITAQDDSPFAAYPGLGWDEPTQEARDATWSSQIQSAFNTQSGGVHFTVGFDIFAWTDKPAEHENFGLVTNLDNAYDGVEDRIQTGTDQWGYPVGGEAANYGDFITSVRSANAGVLNLLLTELQGHVSASASGKASLAGKASVD